MRRCLSALLGVSVILGTSALVRAADETDPRAVETAARQFRIQVYETFRYDRDEFDRRKQAGEEVRKAWNSATDRDQRQGSVRAWFLAATDASRAENVQPLPERPEFAERLVATTPVSVNTATQPATAPIKKTEAAVAEPDMPTNAGLRVLKSLGRSLLNASGQ